MVSISTVARIVPCGMPSASWASDEDVVPQPRLEVALQLRQVEVRALAACRAAPARCGRSTGRSRTSAPDIALAVDERRASRSRCQPRGRTTIVAGLVVELVVLALGRGEARCVRRSRRSRLSWPSIDVLPGGVLASSWSASHTLAPEFSALIAIFAVGRAGDLDAAVAEAGCRFGDLPVALTDVLGLVEEVQRAAVGQLLEAPCAGFEQLAPTRLELAVQARQERQASSVRISSNRTVGAMFAPVTAFPLLGGEISWSRHSWSPPAN